MLKKIVTSTMLVPAMAFGLYATPALAFDWNWFNDDSNVDVTNTNSANVSNDVDVSSSTGGNDADGGSGSTAGDGGDVNYSDDNNSAGNGGNGGNGGDGGVIVTGDAYADALVTNDLNYNRTRVELCGCEEDSEDGDVSVSNDNGASVSNNVDVRAKTGYNVADGGDASECECGAAGDGGDVTYSDDDNSAGDGGDNGDAGWGGLISTGSATSFATVFNTVNTNVTRIRR